MLFVSGGHYHFISFLVACYLHIDIKFCALCYQGAIWKTFCHMYLIQRSHAWQNACLFLTSGNVFNILLIVHILIQWTICNKNMFTCTITTFLTNSKAFSHQIANKHNGTNLMSRIKSTCLYTTHPSPICFLEMLFLKNQ